MLPSMAALATSRAVLHEQGDNHEQWTNHGMWPQAVALLRFGKNSRSPIKMRIPAKLDTETGRNRSVNPAKADHRSERSDVSARGTP